MKEIQLTRGHVAIVDDNDFEWLNSFNWCINSEGYAVRSVSIGINKRRISRMHREILGLSKCDLISIDHINGNRLDNRRNNLRFCSRAENQRNQKTHKDNESGLKGVSLDKNRGVWRARIMIGGKAKFLGHFSNPEDAYFAYCKAALDIHGEFANLGNGSVLIEQSC